MKQIMSNGISGDIAWSFGSQNVKYLLNLCKFSFRGLRVDFNKGLATNR